MTAQPPGPHTPPDFFGLLRVLCEHDVEFVIIGGFAVGLHGFVRATKDVDIVPSPDASNMSRLWTAITSVDARPAEWGDFAPDELPLPFTRDGLIGCHGNWLLYTTLGRLDLLSYVEDDAGEIAYDELRAGAERCEIDEIGRPVWFAGVRHLIAMKEHAGRDVDRIDVTALRMAQGIEDDPRDS